MEKLRVTKEYDKLSVELKEQLKLAYPAGFRNHLITFKGKDHQQVSALRFETEDKIYLIRMTSKQAVQIIDADPDYDDDGNLFDEVKEGYEEKHLDSDIFPAEEI
ncbi:hypothetical protein [Persicobacter psychrovividus]|uniref:Uncharacterized protein n=1 Tax=Persicobacter psychrovividus TaxID=387638 RepID=A0ABN6L935_9BACT|nr:hypothetical protein PEPS_19870 [Persicobacter psychrovividus]